MIVQLMLSGVIVFELIMSFLSFLRWTKTHNKYDYMTAIVFLGLSIYVAYKLIGAL